MWAGWIIYSINTIKYKSEFYHGIAVFHQMYNCLTFSAKTLSFKRVYLELLNGKLMSTNARTFIRIDVCLSSYSY
jgi:hypothetical protein